MTVQFGLERNLGDALDDRSRPARHVDQRQQRDVEAVAGADEARGLDAGTVAYVGKASDGGYEPFVYKRSLGSGDIEIADDVYLIVRERAEEYVAKKAAPPAPTGATPPVPGGEAQPTPGMPTGAPQGATTGILRGVSPTPTTSGSSEPPPGLEVAGFQWSGEISPQKWMNFYTKVLSRFATSGGLNLIVSVDVEPPGGTTVSKVEETKVALRELGLSEDIALKP